MTSYFYEEGYSFVSDLNMEAFDLKERIVFTHLSESGTYTLGFACGDRLDFSVVMNERTRGCLMALEPSLLNRTLIGYATQSGNLRIRGLRKPISVIGMRKLASHVRHYERLNKQEAFLYYTTSKRCSFTAHEKVDLLTRL